MVVAQQVKEGEITEQESLLLTRNLLRIAIFNISYIRGLFPENYFNDKSVPALEMKIKKLMPLDAESRRLIDWMEKGVYDALQKKYLKTLLFCICEDVEGPMIEEYSFSFNYVDSSKEEVSMNISRNGNKKNGATFRTNNMDITPDQMRSSACKMIRTLVQLMRTLDHMPAERIILMKLLYYDDITPEDYEPPFFRSCNENEARNIWTKNPLRMAVGNVNSRHLVLALKVKSILDPCEDDNHHEEEEIRLGANSDQDHDSSSDSEIHPSLAEKYYVAPAGGKYPGEDIGINSDADTQDAAHEDDLMTQVKVWIYSRHTSTFDLADVLSNFPDISVALTEVIVEKLLNEGLLSKVGKDSYTIRREKVMYPKNDEVKQEVVEMHEVQQRMNTNDDEDYMYMKALYHALPMKYVTVGKLQSKLSGEANQHTVKKLLDRMAQDGYIKNSGKKRLGKLVVQSEASNKKLAEVKQLLDGKPMEIEITAKPFEFNIKDLQHYDHNVKDGSTYGALHSIGSDLTRTRGWSESHKAESTHSGQPAATIAKPREQANTPISKHEPIASVESGVLGGKIWRPSGGDGSRSTQDKRSRLASMVKEPILQHPKRQKPEAVIA